MARRQINPDASCRLLQPCVDGGLEIEVDLGRAEPFAGRAARKLRESGLPGGSGIAGRLGLQNRRFVSPTS